MKKLIFTLILPLIVISGLVVANREFRHETPKKSIPKPSGGVPLTATEREAARKKWEATPDGMMFKKWVESPEGKKVYASEAKIRNHLKEFTNMDAVVTSLSLPSGSRLGFGMMVNINDEDYILSFGIENDDEFEQLRSLKVNDKIIVRSRNVSHAPKYSYPIVSGDYVVKDSKIIYNRPPRKGGC